MKSIKSIDAEIAALTALLPKVRQKNVFGEDHRHAIEAQLAVLRRRMLMDDIRYAWGEQCGQFAQNVFDAALDAYDWMRSDLLVDAEPMSVGWCEVTV
jgi:hypothetical protein